MHARSTLIALALLAAGASAQANDLLDQLKEKAGEAATANSQGGAGGSALGNLGSSLGFKMPAIGSSTMGNAAGVLQYCVKNNYLGGDAASVAYACWKIAVMEERVTLPPVDLVADEFQRGLDRVTVGEAK